MMQIPLATYRIQLNADFDFTQLRSIVPYLAELGISDIYAAPILTARSGSNHGYDVVNPHEINPALGGSTAFDELIAELKKYNIGWIQDIVPNHMAFNSQNSILVDVLENGPDSEFRDFFDINWNHQYEDINGRVLAPFLGKFYGDCIESGELQLKYDEDGLSVNYYDWRFPLRIETYNQVLTYDLSRLREKLGRDHPNFVKFLGALYAQKYIPAGEEGRERFDQVFFVKRMLWELWNDCPEVQQFIEENIQTFNGEVGKPESFNLLETLLKEQFFRLSYWKVGNEELNYRRFFTVNDLISLRIEDENVFNTTHSFIFDLIEAGKINGLRIDHIDGLYDPGQYLNRLRERIPNIYLVVEKILETHEELPLNWSIQGTTGYDFLNWTNGILCNHFNEAEFDQVYANFIRRSLSCNELIDDNKRLIIGKHLAGDIDNLAHLLKQLSVRYRYTSDFTMYGLKRALVEILALFPIYRTYVSRDSTRKADRECIQYVVEKAKQKTPSSLNEIYFIEKFLLKEFDDTLTDEDKELWLHFLMRLQQFTGPLMAKGVEDTVFYVYNRLISLNEVGSDPRNFGLEVDAFHDFNQRRSAQCPHSMNATATHDTKRGEDVRARINVLSELPQEWESYLKEWRKLNAPEKEIVNGREAPDPNDEYFLYQTLLGAFPFAESEYPSFVERVKEYIIKAIREAKVHTAWLRPDTNYEEAFIRFVDRLLKQDKDNLFLESFRPCQEKIQHYGIFNSLTQTLLKMTAPGLPDFYQGTELWDLSLVDPDNRRPVNFEQRLEYLRKIKSRSKRGLAALIDEVLKRPEDGRLKLFLIYRVMQTRREHSDLFQRGAYQKLTVVGSLKTHVVTFVREWEKHWAIAITPRLLTSLIKEGEYPLGEQVWHETRITLPAGAPQVWQDAITGQKIQAEDQTLWLKETLAHFPVALLMGQIADS